MIKTILLLFYTVSAQNLFTQQPLAESSSDQYPPDIYEEYNSPLNDGVWKIYRRKADDWLFLQPIQAQHEYTLMFIHGLDSSSFQIMEEEFLPYKDKYLVPKNTKVVLP